MKGNELRQAYLQFFESKGHLKLDSFLLIPENDPSLLLIGAGMAPLKAFLYRVNWYLLVIVLHKPKNVCVQVTLKT